MLFVSKEESCPSQPCVYHPIIMLLRKRSDFAPSDRAATLSRKRAVTGFTGTSHQTPYVSHRRPRSTREYVTPRPSTILSSRGPAARLRVLQLQPGIRQRYQGVSKGGGQKVKKGAKGPLEMAITMPFPALGVAERKLPMTMTEKRSKSNGAKSRSGATATKPTIASAIDEPANRTSSSRTVDCRQPTAGSTASGSGSVVG